MKERCKNASLFYDFVLTSVDFMGMAWAIPGQPQLRPGSRTIEIDRPALLTQADSTVVGTGR